MLRNMLRHDRTK